MLNTLRLTAVLGAISLLTACAPIQTPAVDRDTPVSTPTPTITVTFSITDTGALIQEEVITVEKSKPALANLPQVTQAVDDLAAMLGVAPAVVEVVSVEMVVWPDGSLGCPQPGMIYPQVLQDGLRIRLAVDGVLYQYHSGERRAPFLCKNPSEPAPPGVGGGAN